MLLKVHVTLLVLLSGLFTITGSNPPASPPAPMLISPASGAMLDNGCQDKSNGVTWDFDWSDVPGATAYHIRVWRNPAIPAINNMGVASSSLHYDSPQTYIANHNRGGWHWMVRAKVGGHWGPWSGQRFFRVERLNADCP
jgi:hypothetical protein